MGDEVAGFTIALLCMVITFFFGLTIQSYVDESSFIAAQTVCAQNGGVVRVGDHGSVVCKNGAQFDIGKDVGAK